jgi:hypothetical protein
MNPTIRPPPADRPPPSGGNPQIDHHHHPSESPRSMQRATRNDGQGARDVGDSEANRSCDLRAAILIATEALSLVTSIHHLDKLGILFLPVAVLLVGLPPLLMWWFLRQPSRAVRVTYGTLVALIIVGFGLQDGLWNHTVKMVVFFLRGADRAEMAGLPFPRVGSVFYEVTGVLTFVAAIFAAYFGYQFISKTRKLPPATQRLGRVRA